MMSAPTGMNSAPCADSECTAGAGRPRGAATAARQLALAVSCVFFFLGGPAFFKGKTATKWYKTNIAIFGAHCQTWYIS